MKKWLLIFFVVFWITESYVLPMVSTEEHCQMMKKLKPLIGNWKTHSRYPDSGLEVNGDLKIRWILGGQWMFVEFVGQHPERSVWEAYALIKFDIKEKCYLSYSFFNEKSPVIMTGSWITNNTIRFETKIKTGISGIDYTVNSDGTIYQENWYIPDHGKKEVLLNTDYIRK